MKLFAKGVFCELGNVNNSNPLLHHKHMWIKLISISEFVQVSRNSCIKLFDSLFHLSKLYISNEKYSCDLNFISDC